MTCWGDDEPDPPSDRPKVRGCTDVFWLAIYVSFWFLMIMIAGFALAYGNPRRLVNGYDSFGNTCGAEYNEKIGNFSLTGLNMTSKNPAEEKLIGKQFQCFLFRSIRADTNGKQIFTQIMIAGFALAYGNPRRLVNGYDSFGNTCGAEYNEKIGNFSLTGLNMTSKKYLLFFNMANVGQSMDICVEKCPDRDLLTLDDLRSFYKETGSKLCRYDFDLLGENKDSLHGLNESLLVSSAYGPCPLLPVKKSTPIMNRCVPVTIVEPVKNIVHGVFDLLNSWDFVEQVLGDLYATWHYILAMTFLALRSPGENSELKKCNKQTMDTKVGEMTLNQLMVSFSEILDSKLSNVASKEDMKELSDKVSALERENSQLKEKLIRMEKVCEKTELKLIDLESRSRRNNLIFKGIQSIQGVDCATKVKNFCSNILGISEEIFVNRAHFLGKGTETVIAHFPKDEDIHKIFGNVKKLKNTNIVVHRDYASEVRVKRSKLLALKKELSRLVPEVDVRLGFDFLKIQGVQFYWSSDWKLMSGKEDGIAKLKSMLRVDLANFASRLKEESVGCTIVWWTYYDIKVELDNTPSELLLEEAIQNERAFFLYGIISSVITAVIVLLVCSMRRNLSFLADLFKEASECLSALPSLYLQPILSFVLLLLFYSFWVLVVVCLATANYPGIRPIRPFSLDLDPMLAASASASQPASPDLLSALLPPPANISVVTHKAFTLVQYADALWVRYMWSVYLVALVWVSQFVLSCQQMVVAGAVARWYFNGWKKTTKSPVLTSFRHMICYHLGTMAKGSLLITIFKLPRLILTYLHTKFKKSEEISSCARCGLKSCICCFWCLENFIRYINHNAYTVVAMQGINFCPAAARAFHILMSNAIQFAIINSMGDFILFLGKVIVTAITGSVGLLLIKNNEHLYFYSAPTLVICVFAYFIAHSVISLYEIVIDTLFLCVCEDQNMNGEAGRWRERTLSSIRSTNGNSNSRMVPELKPINS
ncbi:choline transporter-like 1 [Nilaparvata lugens]|uniref:choline transporter-like 1 n=1 Tax=Nilaparvata lugens TaxID=108931 RepID=UPI00193CEAF6|nr:choline transporter-like 1 [Nilaparvata lugens]